MFREGDVFRKGEIFKEGDTFREGNAYRFYQGKEAWHVYVVVFADDEGFVAFNFDTIYQDAFYDKTCLINVGEHEFITDPSYINYGRAGRMKYKDFEKNVKAQGVTVRKGPPAPMELVQKIRDSALRSPHIRPETREFIQKIQGEKKW